MGCWVLVVALGADLNANAPPFPVRRVSAQGGHTTEIGAMAFSAHLSLIATGCHAGRLCVWDYEFGKLLHFCLGHTSGKKSDITVDSVLWLVLSPQLFLFCCLCVRVDGHAAAITDACFLDPYPLLAVADANGNVALWAVRPSPLAGTCVARLVNHRSESLAKGRTTEKELITSTSCAVLVRVPPPFSTCLALVGLGVMCVLRWLWCVSLQVLKSWVDQTETERKGSVRAGSVSSSASKLATPATAPLVILFAADDQGVVKRWSLTKLVQSLVAAGSIALLEKPFPALFPKRNLRAL